MYTVKNLSRVTCLAAALVASALLVDTSVAQEQTVQANVRGHIEYRPPLVRGDSEFNGNGPDVQVSVKFFVENGLLQAQLWMYARETKSDWTTARGLSRKYVVYRPQAGFRVVRIAQSTTYYRNVVNYRMQGHNPKTFNTVLGAIKVYGDRKGKDVGSWTRAVADLNYRMPVVVAPTGGGDPSGAETVTVRRPQTITYVPPHTRGDRDFNGNGPHVQLSARLFARGRVLYLNLRMSARETERDYTTAEGSRSFPIYRAPAGYTIGSVAGTTSFPSLVNAVDNSHNNQTFRNTAIGDITIIGDTRGDEAGTKTRAIVDFKRTVQVTLRRQ